MHDKAPKISIPGTTIDRSDPPANWPLLVLPCSSRESPECPLEVAKTDGLTVAVPYFLPDCVSHLTVTPCLHAHFVTAVVANVVWAAGLDSVLAAEVKNTSAKPGAGTVTVHVLAT